MLRRGINVNLREFHLHKISSHDNLVLKLIIVSIINIQLFYKKSKFFIQNNITPHSYTSQMASYDYTFPVNSLPIHP